MLNFLQNRSNERTFTRFRQNILQVLLPFELPLQAAAASPVEEGLLAISCHPQFAQGELATVPKTMERKKEGSTL